MQDLLRIRNVLSDSDEVAIISHNGPDGDALGSQLALSLGLEQLGIKTVLINKDHVPHNYHFLSSWDKIKPLESIDRLPKVIVFVDCATLERTGYNEKDFKKDGITLLNLDHHVSNNNFADFNWVEEKAAATAEIIYDLLGLLQVKIDENIATALYTGISTDTGSFLYENTTPTTHRVASDLMDKGARINKVRVNYYENMSKGRLELLRKGLNNLSFGHNGEISWMALTQADLVQANAVDADGEGLINYVKNIDGVEVAIVFREIEEKKIKVSLRSKSWFDVNRLASLFDGGGHARASGCVIKGDLDVVTKKVIDKATEGFLGGENIGS